MTKEEARESLVALLDHLTFIGAMEPDEFDYAMECLEVIKNG